MKSVETVFALPCLQAAVKEIDCGQYVVALFSGDSEQLKTTTDSYVLRYPRETYGTDSEPNARCFKEATWGQNLYDQYQLMVVRRKEPSENGKNPSAGFGK